MIDIVSQLDCLQSLANTSQNMSEPRCRPRFSPSSGSAFLSMEELRYPCLSKDRETTFIPNDIQLGNPANSDSRILVLTGPNMGGKSTLLRQTCLAVILAQMGCFVPSKSCHLSPVDRIFTRLGANDNIFAGQSTFMVELTETSRILKEATGNSLVILDELGRGTSTFDGLSIAQATLYYLLEKIGCIGLFATHYRQLAMDMVREPKAFCAFMACDADNEKKKVTFLYKLTPGISPKSYGMNVALLAGVPPAIIDEADKVAAQFETCLSLGHNSKSSSIKVADICNLLMILS